MTPAAWIAFAGLFFAIIIQSVGLAFWLGGISARVRSIENHSGNDDCASQLAAMNATLVALKENVGQRFDTLEKTVAGIVDRQTSASRRSAG